MFFLLHERQEHRTCMYLLCLFRREIQKKYSNNDFETAAEIILSAFFYADDLSQLYAKLLAIFTFTFIALAENKDINISINLVSIKIIEFLLIKGNRLHIA